MSKDEHKTELGSLKARLEWRVCIPRRAWVVEGYNIIRRRNNYRDEYVIDIPGPDGGTVAILSTLTEAFQWIAETIEPQQHKEIEMNANPLTLIAAEAAAIERRLIEAVDKAKDDGRTWAEISQATGISVSNLKLRWSMHVALTLCPDATAPAAAETRTSHTGA